jgi:hypothetical protein
LFDHEANVLTILGHLREAAAGGAVDDEEPERVDRDNRRVNAC